MYLIAGIALAAIVTMAATLARTTGHLGGDGALASLNHPAHRNSHIYVRQMEHDFISPRRYLFNQQIHRWEAGATVSAEAKASGKPDVKAYGPTQRIASLRFRRRLRQKLAELRAERAGF